MNSNDKKKRNKKNRIIDNCILVLLEYHINMVKYHLDTIGFDGTIWWIYFKDDSDHEIRFEDVYVGDKGEIFEYRIEIH
jgi:hypothetical protein